MVAVAVLAFGLRALYISQAWAHPAVRIPVIDAEAYRARALEILGGDWIGSAVYYLDPLYPFFLAAIYAVVPPDTIWVLLAQAALDTASVVMLMLLAQRVFDARTALVTGLLGATYSIFFYYDALLLKAPLMIFLMVTALFFVVRAADRDQPIAWLPAGFFLGLAALTRGNSLLFAPVLGLWIMALGKGATKRRLLSGIVLVIGLSAAILPGSVRNYVVGGDFVLLNSQGGQNFYIGHFEGNDSGAYAAPPFLRPNPVFEESDFAIEARRRSGLNMTPSEISSFWLKEGLAAIAADPLRFVKHSGRKVLVLWNGYEIPDNASLDYFRREVGGVLRWPLPSYAVVLPLAMMGFLLSWRRPLVGVLALFVVSYSAGIVLFFNLSRLRLPIVPVLLVLAGYGLVEALRLMKARAWRNLALPGIVFLIFVGITQLDLIEQNIAVRYVNMGAGFLTRSESLWGEAERLREQGDEASARPLVEESFEYRVHAEQQFSRAREESPGYPRAMRAFRRSRATTAVLLAHLNRTEESLEVAQSITKEFPNFPGGHVLVGKAEMDLGRIEKARVAFEQALRLKPNHPEASKQLELLTRAAGADRQ